MTSGDTGLYTVIKYNTVLEKQYKKTPLKCKKINNEKKTPES